MAVENAESVMTTRYVLFQTMILSLQKTYGTDIVIETETLNFLDFQHLTQETVSDIDAIDRDGVNGWIQAKFNLQQALRNIKGGKFEGSLEFSEGPIVDALDCVSLSSKDDYDDN